MKKEELYPSYYGANNKRDLLDLYSKGLLSGCNPFESFCYGNVIKYIVRHNGKNGTNDLNKAKVYLNRLKEYYQENDNSDKTNSYDDYDKLTIKHKQHEFKEWYNEKLAKEFNKSNEIKSIIFLIINLMYEKDKKMIEEAINKIDNLIYEEGDK